MDKVNGLRVLQQIRADGDTAEVPVIMITAAGDRKIEMSLFEAGAADFIAKPSTHLCSCSASRRC